MFLGEYQPNVTEGFRVALPKKFRDLITGESVVLSRGFEKCIFLYSLEAWQLEAEKQIDNPITDKKTRALKRYLYANATEASIDSQGRVVLPAPLREYAGVQKSAVVLGAGDHVEIWDLATWESYLSQISKELAEE